MQQKLKELERYIDSLRKVIVAFSGGVDSALLAFLARRNLEKEDVLAVTGDSASIPSRDRDFVIQFCKQYDIPHRFIETYEYEDLNYRANPSDRCFYCKQELYRQLKKMALQFGFSNILDGTNVTDLKGHRPGFKALKEQEIIAPYLKLDIDKQMIRSMAEFFKLEEVATKPQAACLASRIPTGTPIHLNALQKIDEAENILKDLGIKNPRVRFHEKLARLQLKQEEWILCLEKRKEIQKLMKQIGFEFVTLDLKEYDREG